MKTLPPPRTTLHCGHVFTETWREATPAERARIEEGMRRFWRALERLAQEEQDATAPPPVEEADPQAGASE